MSDPTGRLLRLFGEALECASPQEQAAYLDRVCRDDAGLRARLEALLSAHRGAGPLPDGPAAPARSVATVDEAPGREAPGTAVGPYKLLEQIGEGGFGVVFLAEQQQPLRRQVALKVLKPGMDTREVVARFEAERQALALMDHPNIAHVFDGGETASGRPYFVMELVRGLPITRYCDQSRLTPRERLALFADVCRAVQHAHQKGVIHRDLKPSNLLVTLHDGTPVPKVIDFGIAKALGQRLTDKTLFTGFAQLIGTPLYMSPEQAALGGLDVDTRTDVYSLGVVLYELLTGTTPFDAERLRQAPYDEMRRIIREEEPPRPSTRISTLGPAAATVSARRHSDPRRLRQLLRGEVDWIVLKALEKDRNRRYESAGALAADVQRYLAGEPVQACPPSRAYRLRKALRKHWAAALTAAAFAGLLLAGAAVSTWQWRLAEGRRVQAEQAARTVRAINDFLVKDMLAAGTPENARGRKVTAEEVLDRAAARIEGAFPGQPQVEVEVQNALGSAYRSLGLYAKAEPHFQHVVVLRQELLGAEHRDTLAALTQLGALWAEQDRFAEAEQLCRQTLEKARRVLGEDDPVTLELEHWTAYAVRDQGRPEESEGLFRHCLQGHMRVLGEDHSDTLETMLQFGYLLGDRLGKWQEAEPLLRHCMEVRERTLGKDHPDTLIARVMYADAVLKPAGRWQEAEAVERETLAGARRSLGPSHDRTLDAEHDLGIMLARLDRLDEAERVLRDCVAVKAGFSGPEDPEVLTSQSFLAEVLLARGKLDEAEQEFRATLESSRRVRGPDDSVTIQALAGTGLVYQARGRWAEAEGALREAVERCHRAHRPDDPVTRITTAKLAVFLEWAGKDGEAGSLLRAEVEARRRALAPEHPRLAGALYAWAEYLLGEGDLKQAEPALDEALRIQRAALPPRHRDLGSTLAALGWLYTRSGRAHQGEPLLREGLDICRGSYPPQHWAPADAASRLGECLAAQGRFSEAEPLLVDACQALQGIPGAPPPRTRQAVERVVRLYEAAGKPVEAAAWRAKLPPQAGDEPRKDK